MSSQIGFSPKLRDALASSGTGLTDAGWRALFSTISGEVYLAYTPASTDGFGSYEVAAAEAVGTRTYTMSLIAADAEGNPDPTNPLTWYSTTEWSFDVIKSNVSDGTISLNIDANGPYTETDAPDLRIVNGQMVFEITLAGTWAAGDSWSVELTSGGVPGGADWASGGSFAIIKETII